MLIAGCDYHPGFQQIACVETNSAEVGERPLMHNTVRGGEVLPEAEGRGREDVRF